MTRILALLPLLACTPKPRQTAAYAVQIDPAVKMVDDMQKLDFEHLGNPVLRWDWIPPLRAPAAAPHKALVVLVEFSDVKFDRFAGDANQDLALAAFYQNLLFDSKYQKKDTLSHFYATQSGGRYHLDGVVVPTVKLDQPLSAFGAPDRPEGGTWRNDKDPDGLIVAALAKAARQQPDVVWSEFDRWDPHDFDKDGEYDEADGYVDHLVIVYAGGGQHACQSLRKLDEALNPNVGMDAVAGLSPEQRACADRIWPHRDEVRINEGQGPVFGGISNPNGGTPVFDDLWVRNYNMQSEYTEESTFIHETGHSLGLPDVYAMTATNSTGPWEAMSNTADPSPQNFSAWSRMQLGWLEPEVVVPPRYGGESEVTVDLADLGTGGPDATRAVLVVLPPKQRELELTRLPEAAGKLSLYSGQGNDLNRTATLSVRVPDEEPVMVEFDAWWEIEGGWDFAYVELSADGGRTWERLLPTDPRQMPAKHGHDGPDTRPGLTGLSGDLDGDGKNESAEGCDPTAEIAHGEDRANQEKSPCETATWARVEFDLSARKGQDVKLRWRYFTDGAAVENGLLVDNVAIGNEYVQDFEHELGPEWSLDGFTTSPGHHSLLVPHYYLLEYRDPYVEADSYDKALAEGAYSFFWDPARQGMGAVRVLPRPGVVAWYYDGAFAWSENDPAMNGPGKGYLLAIDSNPNELSFPGAAQWLVGDPAAFDTHYALEGEGVQDTLKESFFRTMCFVRNPAYVPPGMDPEALKAWCQGGPAPVESIDIDGRKAKYSYEYIDLLPGAAREPWQRVGELYDFRERDGETTFRLRDRTLRYYHTNDDPFSPEPFAQGVTTYEVRDGALVEVGQIAAPAVTTFSDADPARWLNPNLPFGGVAVPTYGLGWEVTAPGDDAPPETRATVTFRWADGG